uniref:Retrotransposon gag domain-containing protein n=1 Tax=Ananas comosus var. bracteatus TaxID=296719 RepID=A0A6V7NYF7_ANACO|nr:unnamed protein product [Ananas comosus var. bracteatus]
MSEVRQMFVGLQASLFGGTSRDAPSKPRAEGNNPIKSQLSSRFTKVEFPRFNGMDLKGWVYRCEQFFEIDGTEEDAKVKLATIHLESRALQWHQVYMKSRLTHSPPTWEEYVFAVNTRFGVDLYDDPMAEHKELRQVGSIMEYQDMFDALLNRVVLTEEYAIRCFLSGLKKEIQIPVRDVPTTHTTKGAKFGQVARTGSG